MRRRRSSAALRTGLSFSSSVRSSGSENAARISSGDLPWRRSTAQVALRAAHAGAPLEARLTAHAQLLFGRVVQQTLHGPRAMHRQYLSSTLGVQAATPPPWPPLAA